MIVQAIATLGAVPQLVRLLDSKDEVIAEGALETIHLQKGTSTDGRAILLQWLSSSLKQSVITAGHRYIGCCATGGETAGQ